MGWGNALTRVVPHVLAVALTGSAGAATITVHEPDAHGRVFIDLVGKIEAGDYDTFVTKTAAFRGANPTGRGKVIVTLVSYGGQTGSAVRIGHMIRMHGMSTFVPGGRICTSGCALIWVAGASRLVGDAPHIGFHAAYHGTTKRESGAANAVIGAYLRDLGLGYDAITFMTSKGATSIEWLTPDAAKQLGITWATLDQPRTSHTPPQPKIRAPPPPSHLAAAWSKSIQAAAPPAPQPSLQTVKTVPASAQPGPPSVREPARPASNADSGNRLAYQSSTGAPRVVLYEEDSADPRGKRFIGSGSWRTEPVTPASGGAAELAVHCDITIPERHIALTMSIRRNRDKAVPASHVVEFQFKLAEDFPFGGVGNVPGILMKVGETTRGTPLTGLAVKVTPSFFLLGLSAAEAEMQRNLELIRERSWVDVPVVYGNGRRAIIAIEKGRGGEQAFRDAFYSWRQDGYGG